MPDPSVDTSDDSWRTWLAAERTWLAWWRTGIGVGAVALAVGRFLPGLTGGARRPFRLLDIGYGLLSVAVLLVGATRHQHAALALRLGTFTELSPPLVAWLTAGGVALSVVAMILVAAAL